MIKDVVACCLIDYLKKQNSDKWVSKKEVCDALPEYFTYNYDPRNHDECASLRDVKNYVNNNAEKFNIIIISDKYGNIKIPTKDEAEEYLKKEFKNACLRFKRYWNKAKAIGLVDQGKLDGSFYDIVSKEN